MIGHGRLLRMRVLSTDAQGTGSVSGTRGQGGDPADGSDPGVQTQRSGWVRGLSLAAETADAIPGHLKTDDQGRRWIALVSSGTRWPKPLHDTRGPQTITEDVIDSLVANFADPVPIKATPHADLRGDTSTQASEAWAWIDAVKTVTHKGRKWLLGLVSMPDRARKAIDEDRAFRWPSVEIMPGRDPGAKDETPIGAYLRGAVFTNHPVWDAPALFALCEGDPAADHGDEGNQAPGANQRRNEEETTVSDTKILAERLGVPESKVDSRLSELLATEQAHRTMAEEHTTVLAERDAIRAELDELKEATAKAGADSFIARLLSEGLPDDDKLKSTLHTLYLADEAAAETLGKASCTVKIAPKGRELSDKSKRPDDTAADGPMEAGAKLHKMALALCSENPDLDYEHAFRRVQGDDKNRHLAEMYEREG
jgi:hypothetical protein